MTSLFEQCHEIHLELLAALVEHVGLELDSFSHVSNPKTTSFECFITQRQLATRFGIASGPVLIPITARLPCFSMTLMAAFRYEIKLAIMLMLLLCPMLRLSMVRHIQSSLPTVQP